MNKSSLPIANPCPMDWASMTPADRGRFCGECKKVVHELVRMTEKEAKALLHSAKNGELCVRYMFDAQGNIFFADTPRLVAPSLLNRARRAAAVAAAIAVPMTLGCSSTANGIGGASSSGEVMGGAPAYDDRQDKQITEPSDPDTSDASADSSSKSDGGADANDPQDDPGDASSDSYVPPT